MVKRYTSSSDDPQKWIAEIATSATQVDVHLLQKAIHLYDNPDSLLLKKGLFIADILLNLKLDRETLAAAIVYPALQMHELHLDTLVESLGESGADCSKLLHDALQLQSLGKIKRQELREHQVENLRKMLLAMVTDLRAVLIILAERLWQLHQVKKSLVAEQQQLAQESLDIFAPLANRLGVWQLKWEIEDLCLRYLQPEIYNKIAKGLASRRQEREAYIHRVIQIVTAMLEAAHIKHFQITGRVKHIYSIYRKMVRKSSSMDEIYDVSAIRILVNDIADCYSVLGLLQNTWQHVPEEFDDYISQPKPNGYRSLHTVVLGPENHFVEVQIRTFQMHQESESGMSAHWQYKEGVLQPSTYEAKIALLRQIIDWQKEVVGHEKGDKALQDLFADRVYVFTPTGDIIDLPKGATPLDFAYHIHSEVGHRCRGAKVNGNMVSLKYALQTGESVEILTTKQANPSRDWLNPHLGYLKTARARAKALHWFRMREGLQNLLTGRALLEKELKKIGFNEKFDVQHLAQQLHYKSADDLLSALATGEIRMVQIIHLLRPVSTAAEPAIPPPTTTVPFSQLQISGINNLLTQIARCCKPLPGDLIIGYVTRTRGVSIHRRDCANVQTITPEKQDRLIAVNWGEKTSRTYPVDLQLRVYDRSGLLRDVTSLLASEKINVLGLQAHTHPNVQETDIYLMIEISNREQLKRALELLQKIPNVIQAKRRE